MPASMSWGHVDGAIDFREKARKTLGQISDIDEMAILVDRDVFPLEGYQYHMAS
jgi:hypothetical protein